MLIDVANKKIKMPTFKILLQGVIFALCFILFGSTHLKQIFSYQKSKFFV